LQPVSEVVADAFVDDFEHAARSRPRAIVVVRRIARRRVAVASAAYLACLILATILVPSLTGYGADEIDLVNPLASSSMQHLLGTDENGRDMLTRLFVGAQGSLTIGFVAMLVAVVVGTLIGGIAGFLGNIADSSLMTITDTFLAVPIFFIVMTVLMLFGPTLQNIVLVIGLTSWMTVARVVRSEVLRIKTYEFVTAATALGASRFRVFFRHILPQALPSIIVAASIGLAWAILVETSLSYLGLGVQPPDPSWGNMLANAQQYMYTKPLLAVYPGVLIFLTVLAFNYLGSVLREVLDSGSAAGR
jgi:peptide/nickel transport system permease protein